MQKRKLNSSLLLALMIKQAVDDWKKNPVAPAAPLAYLGRQAVPGQICKRNILSTERNPSWIIRLAPHKNAEYAKLFNKVNNFLIGK